MTSPDIGLKTPKSALTKLLLPEPLAPKTASIVPAGISMSGALKRVRPGNPTVRSRIWRSLDISGPSKSATKGLQIKLSQQSSEHLAHIGSGKRGAVLLIDYSIS